MNRSHILIFLVLLAFVSPVDAQKKRPLPSKKNNNLAAAPKNPRTAVVIDERLAILRLEPSLYSDTIQRMRTGRIPPGSAITTRIRSRRPPGQRSAEHRAVASSRMRGPCENR